MNTKNMSKKLTQEEIEKRMARLYSLEKMYKKADQVRTKLKAENKALKEKNTQIQPLKEEVEKLKLQVEELKRGKFRKNRDSRKKSQIIPKCDKTKKADRSDSSYRRPEPKTEDITGEVFFEAKTCPECKVELINKQESVHFVEDLEKQEKLLKQALQIIKVTIQSGKCPKCNTIVRKMKSPKQKVIIGENLRRMIVFKAIYMGHTYTETQKTLLAEYGISIANGQIANILAGESKLLSPYYEQIVKDLSNESAHYDETSWKTKSMGDTVSEGNYCWVKVGVESQKQLIWFGKSRGKQVAIDLRGEKKNSKGVSDDYGAYIHLFDAHQLCWAHPHRKLRDLADSGQLSVEKLKVCKKAFSDFKNVYNESGNIRKLLLAGKFSDFSKIEDLKNKFLKITKENKLDPEKLTAIRKRLKERMDKYFTFLKYPVLPLDNNKAERKIRKVVLKRKKSFGSRSQKGADTLSILYSVVFTMTEENPDKNFFELYNQAAEFGSK